MDVIALQCVYMNELRRQIHSFQETWNKHPIRKQKLDHIVTGKVNLIYNSTLTDDLPRSLGVTPNPATVDALLEMVAPYDLDELLQPDVASLCSEMLLSPEISAAVPGYSGEFEVSLEGPHKQVYTFFRRSLRRHIQQGGFPLVPLETPVGNVDWINELENILRERDGHHDEQIRRLYANLRDFEEEVEEDMDEEEEEDEEDDDDDE